MANLSVKLSATLTPGKTERFLGALEDVFEDHGADVEVDIRHLAIKSFSFPQVFIAISDIAGNYLAYRYVVDPLVDNIEEFILEWGKAVHKRLTNPVQVTIHLKDLSLEVETAPYINDKEYLGNLWGNLQKILSAMGKEKIMDVSRKIQLTMVGSIIEAFIFTTDGLTHKYDRSSNSVVRVSREEREKYQ